ncbi:hypothetical protein Tco_0363707 [Tanacetum coccineum]
MCTYLKNMEGWKPKDLKNKSFANIQGLFDKAMKRVNTFVDYRTELIEESSKKAELEIAQESSSKRTRDELEQENAKKQKVDEDKETAELQSLIEVVPDEEEVAIDAVDAVPLATKPPTIIDWKIHKEGKKSYYQIIRADGSSKRQTDAEQRRPTIKKLEVKQVEFKLGEDCWEIQTSLAANARRNNEKALNILLSAIPDRHLLSFHDAVDARSLWKAIKARFGGNEASKKMFQNILSCLNLHDEGVHSKMQIEVSMKLQSGLYFEKVLRIPTNYPKDIHKLPQARFPLLPNYASHSDENHMSFFSKQCIHALQLMMMRSLYKIDEDAMEEIDIRWQVAMITARIRKFMRKTGRPIDLKPKNGITFDKSKIEWFGIESSNSMESDISSGDETLTDSTYENFKREKAYKAVPPPTGTIIPPRANVSFTGIDELAIRNKVVNQEKTNTSQSAIDRNKVIIEDWVDSDDEETDVSESQKETIFNTKHSEESFQNRSPNSQNSVGQESRTKGLGNKGGKLCFVCYSPNHLIKDCNLHERTFIQTQTHKSKGTQGSRDTRPVWNNINRVNHSNFSRNSKYPHQRRSFIPSAVLTREGLKSTARPKWTRTVPSKSTARLCLLSRTMARPKVPHAVPSQSTGRPYYPRMDNTRPRTSSFSRTPYRPQRPKKIVKSIWVKKGSTVGSQAVLPQTVKESAMIKSNQTWRPKGNYLDSVNRDNGSYTLKQFEYGNPEEDLKDYAIIDSGCSGSMTGDKDKLSDFKEFKGGYVAFGNDSKGGRISGKGTIKTSCLDFEKVSYVEELKFNLLSVSQICDKKHNVLFTDKECLILSPKFKFVDEDLVILRAPRKNDVYSQESKRILFPLEE